MSEDLSEGEKGDGIGELIHCETPRKQFQRNISNLEVWSDDKKEKKLYIVLIRYVCLFSNILVKVSYLCISLTKFLRFTPKSTVTLQTETEFFFFPS